MHEPVSSIYTSSLTINNTPIATPSNQVTNQKFTSTDPLKKHPHPQKQDYRTLTHLKYQPKSVTTITIKFLLHIRFQPEKNQFLIPAANHRRRTTTKEGQRVRTDGNQCNKLYAEIVRQSQCHQYKNNNSTKSPPRNKNSSTSKE